MELTIDLVQHVSSKANINILSMFCLFLQAIHKEKNV